VPQIKIFVKEQKILCLFCCLYCFCTNWKTACKM